MRILLIEDESRVAQFVKKGLLEEGHVVDLARDGVEGLALASVGEYDVIVLDVMLPGKSGFPTGFLGDLSNAPGTADFSASRGHRKL